MEFDAAAFAEKIEHMVIAKGGRVTFHFKDSGIHEASYSTKRRVQPWTEERRTFSDEVKKQLFHPGYICTYCGNEILSIDDAEVDHIVLFSQGGKTEISNAQLLHRHCNREKSDSMEGIDVDFEEAEDEMMEGGNADD